MKQRGKKILAIMLVTAMVFQTLTGLFPIVKQVEANDTSGSTSEWDYEINFENADVKKLTDFTSTKFDSANDYGIVEQDKTIYDHWYTGTADTDTYGRETGYKTAGVSWSSGNRSAGLKALTGYGKTYRYLATYGGAQYENFEVVSEIHSNLASDGIAFGEKNVFPASSDSTSARVYFTGSNTGGRLALEGAFDYTSYKVTGNEADTTNLGFNTKAQMFTFHSGGIDRGQMFELHIKKEGRTVTIWAEGYSPVLTIELASAWVDGPVALCTNGTAPGGGFKSFAVKGWAYDNFNFENADVKKITDFTSTKFDSANNYGIVEQDKTIYDHWYTGTADTDTYGRETGYKTAGVSWSSGNRSAGLKALTGYGRTYLYLATYGGAQYENFEVVSEIHSNLASDGIAFGEKNVFPASSDSTSAGVYFTGTNTAGRLQLEGAFDYKSWEVTGRGSDTTLGFNTNTNVFTFHNAGLSRGQMFELHIKKEGTKVTIWVEGYSPVLTIELADTWVVGPVSLYTKGTAPGGGFKSFTIRGKGLQSIDFGKISAKNIIDFTSTKFDSANGYGIVEQDKTIYEHWYTGSENTDEYGRTTGYVDQNVSTASGNRSAGLKALTGYGKTYRYLATYTGAQYENFEVVSEIHSNMATDGIAFGEKNVFPSSANSSSARVYFSGNTKKVSVKLEGAFDYNSWEQTGTNDTTGYQSSSKEFVFATSDTEHRGKLVELHIEKNGNLVTIWAEGYEAVFTIELASTWKSGPVALCSNGTAPGGGFNSFAIKEYQEKTKPEDEHEVNVDFTQKSLARLPYTSTQFSIDDNLPIEGEIDQSLTKHWFSREDYELYGGQKTRNNGAKSNQKNDAKIYTYMNLGQSYDSFEATVEIFNGSYHGIAFGKKNEFYSVKDSSSVGVYILNGGIQLEGAVVFSSAEVTGDGGKWTTGGGVGNYKFTSKMNMNEIYKIHVKVSKLDNMSFLEIWVDGYESKLTVELSNKYQKEEIALVSRSFQGDCGGIKSLLIKETQNNWQRPSTENGFQTIGQVEELFDAYHLSDASKSTKLQKVSLKEHWRLGRYGHLSRANNVTDSSLVKDVEVLTYTAQKYTDFELTYSYQQTYARLGIMFGTELGEYPISVKDKKKSADQGAIFFISAEGKPYISGKLTGYTSTSELWYGGNDDAKAYFVEPDATTNVSAGKEHTVKIVVKNRELYAYIDGSATPSLYMDLGESYKGGYISLISHAKDCQGFKTFSIKDTVTTELPSAGGVHVSGNTVTADFNSAKFDNSLFTSYYMETYKNNKTGDMVEKPFKELWTIMSGTINRHLLLEDGGEGNKVAALTYNKPLTDFVVSFDYQKYGRYPMFMLGAEKGKYALGHDSSGDIKNGGLLLILENDLGKNGGVNMYGDANPTTETYRPMARQKRVFEGYADAKRGSWHTMTIAVVNKQLYVYLDDYGLVTTWALSDDYDGGYISFMATGKEYGLDNFKITDLSAMTDNSIVSAEGARDITVQRGTDLEQLGLPTSMNVTLKNGTTTTVDVEMINMNYDKTKEGVYQFTAVPIENESATNPGYISATVNVRVVEKITKLSAAVKEWTFDSADDLKDFKQSFYKNEETGYVSVNMPRWYVSNSGRLNREPWKMPNGDLKKELSILTYEGETYTNFELEVDYTQYPGVAAMIMFGSKTSGSYINLKDLRNKDNPVVAFVEYEGVRNFAGNVINTDFYSRTEDKIYQARESGVRLKQYYDANSKLNSGKWHTMRLRVVGNQASLWVDDNPVPHTITLTDYNGGYVSLVSTYKATGFDNLKITRLDAKGNVLGTDPSVLANGKVIVSVDKTASSDLVIPQEYLQSEQNEEILEGNIKKPSEKLTVVAVTVVLTAILVDVVMITFASKKKKKEER